MGRVQRFRIRYGPQGRPMRQWLSRNSFQTSEIRVKPRKKKLQHFSRWQVCITQIGLRSEQCMACSTRGFSSGAWLAKPRPSSFQSQTKLAKTKSTPVWFNKDAAVSLAYQRRGNWLGWTRHEHLYLTWGFWDRGEPSGWVQRVEGVNGTKECQAQLPFYQEWMGKGTPYCKFARI